MQKPISKTCAWFLIAASLLIAAGLIFYYNHIFYKEFLAESGYVASYPLHVKTPGGPDTLVEIEANGKKRLFSGKLDENIYPLHAALDSVAQAGQFTYQTRNGRIYALAGLTGSWKIYKNGYALNTALDKMTIASGDKYALKLEK